MCVSISSDARVSISSDARVSVSSDAWWMTRLSDTVGEFPTNAFFPIHTSFGIYVGIRWSDGWAACRSRAHARAYPRTHART
eukprot:6196240-Pleurochrysis_carterae.AAC.4